MPQLDKVTFLTQYTWLIITYCTFYLLLVKHFLPKMATLLKLRQHKINPTQQQLSTQEKVQVQNAADSLVQNAAKSTQMFFHTTLDNTAEWIAQTLQQTNKSQLQNVNQSYIQSLNTIYTQQNTIQMLHAKAVLAPRAHVLAGIKTQSGPQKEAFFTEAVVKSIA